MRRTGPSLGAGNFCTNLGRSHRRQIRANQPANRMPASDPFQQTRYAVSPGYVAKIILN
jgi:hypothetical protein